MPEVRQGTGRGTANGGSLQAVLLDRDGTINRERSDYVKSWAEFEWLPGALDALCDLAQLGVPVLVISNQSPLGRGILSQATLADIHGRLQRAVVEAGGRIDTFFVCPHRPDEQCSCRKPAPGLLLQAADAYYLDLGRCIFVGDTVTDYQAALAAGCPVVLVRTGRQGEQLPALLNAAGAEPGQVPIVDDLPAAVALVLAANPGGANQTGVNQTGVNQGTADKATCGI